MWCLASTTAAASTTQVVPDHGSANLKVLLSYRMAKTQPLIDQR